MTAIANLPDLRPSLLLDFSNSGRVDPRIQCTRASAATCFGPDGKLRTVAANVPRIDYDPATGKCLGMLAEEGRTNYVISSNTFDVTAWNASNGLVRSAGNGIRGVNSCRLDKLSGSGSLYFSNTAPSLTANAGEIFSLSILCFGNATIRLNLSDFSTDSRGIRLNLANGTTSIDPDGSKFSVKGSSVRHLGGGVYSLTISVLVIAKSSVRLSIDVVDIGFVEFAAPQLELGSFPTSYIPTEASAVTRVADNIQLELGPWFRGDAGTWSAQHEIANRSLISGTETIISVSHRTENNRLQLRTGVVTARETSGVLFERILATPASSGTTAMTYGSGKTSVACRGVLYAEQLYAKPIQVQRLHLGVIDQYWAGYWLNGHIRELRFYPAQITREQLQRLTS